MLTSLALSTAKTRRSCIVFTYVIATTRNSINSP